jgi:hypothetical protein
MQNICEDGYQGNHDPASSNDEVIEMTTDSLDDGSVVVNLDVWDTDQQCVVKMGGYVMVKQDDEEKRFYVLVYNGKGDVLSQTLVPFDFVEC